MRTDELLLALDEQRQQLAANLSQKGVAASGNEGLEALVPKILEIAGSSGGVNFGEEIKIFRTTQTGTITVPDDFTDIRQLLCASPNTNYNGTWFFDGDNCYSESKDILYGIGTQVYSSPDGCAYWDDTAGRYMSILQGQMASSSYVTIGARLTGNKLSIVEMYRLSNTPLSASGDKVIFYRV